MNKTNFVSSNVIRYESKQCENQKNAIKANVINLGAATRLTLGGTGPGVEAFAGRPGPRVTTC